MTSPHSNRPMPKVFADSDERASLLAILREKSVVYERQMPNVEAGAICSGVFLAKRGYAVLGQYWLRKKESNGEMYLFRALPQIKETNVTASPLHPFYELE